MIEAALWSLVASSSLLVGAAIALRFDLSQRTIGLIMGFGAGVLVAALSVDLAADAFERTNGLVLGLGLAAGGVAFFVGDLLLDRYGGQMRKMSGGEQAQGSAARDRARDRPRRHPGVGRDRRGAHRGAGGRRGVRRRGVPLNLPEALSATSGLAKSGWSTGKIFGLWALVSGVCALAALLAFGFLDESNQTLIGFILAFAAGAILAMLADTMFPEAYEHAGKVVALVTVLGFAVGFVIVEREHSAAPAPPAAPSLVARR